MKKGFYGIGCLNMKNILNYGSLFRTAQLFNADFIFLIGKRFKKQASDTMHSYRHIPLYEYNDFNDFLKHLPYSCPLIGIELHKKSIPISNYKHRKQACYLLGAEDNGLTNEAINSCVDIISLPTERSLNVAVAGSIVLFDRINKEVL